jgi:hypothetical protein
MRRHISVLLATSALAIGSALSGCASTATGQQTSSFAGTPQVGLAQTAPRGTILAVVRYPAFVESDDEADFARAYAQNAIGGREVDVGRADAEALANSVVLKSNYFAMSLYRELAERLPEHSVLLSPHRVYHNDNGVLTSEPMTEAESLPTVVTVDFTAYTYPDFERMMGAQPLTFGDLITPVVTVRTDPRASVASEGVLLASSPVIGAAAGGNQMQAVEDAQAVQAGRLEAGASELDFISHIAGTPRVRTRQASLRSRSPGAVRTYPLEKIRLDSYQVSSLENQVSDVLEAPFTDAFASQVIDLINGTDIRKASMLRKADVIADYDESLAALSLVEPRDADVQARLRYAERLLEAEQKYLSVQSLRLYDGVMNGEMGAQVRDMILEEFEVLQRRRKLARQQNISTMAAIAAVVGGVAIASNSGNDGQGASGGEILATQAMIQGAVFAAGEAVRRNRLSKGVAFSYLDSVMPAIDAQTEVQLDLIDSNETITAIRFEDLKAKLSELYAENQRSLDVAASRCAYDGPAGQGTWLGECANGFADGPGVGVYRNGNGFLVEHYGYARAGRADGPGYRIVRAPEGSYALEGNFSGGLANGVARVERSGSVEVRRFREGRDMGAAPAGTRVASPFDRAYATTGAPTG